MDTARIPFDLPAPVRAAASVPTVPRATIRYAVAVLAAFLAVALSLSLPAWTRLAPVSFFYLAVVVAGWYGGPRAGLLAAFLSILLADYFVFPPAGSLSLSAEARPSLVTFALVSLLMTVVTASFQRARRRADQ